MNNTAANAREYYGEEETRGKPVGLKEFIDKYGRRFAEQIERNLTPVYNPEKPEGTAEYETKMGQLLRTPFPVQGEIIKAVSKAMYDAMRHHVFVVGEMGSGKTIIALSVLNNAPPTRTLVVCPTHLVTKWVREAKETIPDCIAVDLTVTDVISVLAMLRENIKNKPDRHEVYVISKEKFKLSYGWKPAYVMRKGSDLPHCPVCGRTMTNEHDNYVTATMLKNKRMRCSNTYNGEKCGSPLWQADRKLKRFAPAEYIKKYMKGFFDIGVIDEIQDYKAEGSLQGRAMGALIKSVKYTMCLTGTLNGGYADDLYHLLFRMEPSRLKADGFGHGNSIKWLETFGTIEKVKKLEDTENYYGRGKKSNVIVYRKPGVAPQCVGKYLLDKAVFIRLADVIEGLPPYEENVLSFEMEGEQKEEYGKLQEKLKAAVKVHKTRAIGAMLQSLLSYPDSCTVFPELIEIKDKDKNVLEIIEAPKVSNCSETNKEKELISLVRAEKKDGRKVLCYVTFTNSRDIRPRIKEVLEAAKIRVGILDVSVAAKKREAWVAKHAKDIDVLICNAELVKTGLDLYEFPTVVFFQVGYNIFTLRQAARRSWRIGQKQPVKVFFYCYRYSMQETAISLIAKKLETALLVEGELPEGLAEYGSNGESMVRELTKALVDGGNYTGAEKAWAGFRKKEIESQLSISGKETIFVAKSEKGKIEKSVPKTEIKDNVVIKVSFVEGKRKSRSIIEVEYGNLDKVAEGRPVQFCLF